LPALRSIATPTTGVITSSTAAADFFHTTGVGWGDPADGYTKAPPLSNIALAFTQYGDTDLNQSVDHLDAFRFSEFYPTASGATWDEGDFNYDGKIDSTDQALLAAFMSKNPAVLSINRTGPVATTANSNAVIATRVPKSTWRN
jgi:hypothetical protein